MNGPQMPQKRITLPGSSTPVGRDALRWQTDDGAVDTFAVQLVLDGTPMNLTGVDLEAAVMALLERGHTYAEIGHRCRITEGRARKVADAVRARESRARERRVA